MQEHDKFVIKASSYIDDGLSDSECIEMLIIDGASRESAEGYVNIAKKDTVENDENMHEYSFQFEDSYGKVWSSHDIGRTVRAYSDEDAWDKAEEIISDDTDIEADKIIGINRIS